MTAERTVSTDLELLSVLSAITFPNSSLNLGWRYSFQCGTGTGWLLQLQFQRIDCHTGEMGVGNSRYEYIANGATVSAVVKTAWLLFKTTVEHEMMEAFHWEGKRIFNPHNTVQQLASLQ